MCWLIKAQKFDELLYLFDLRRPERSQLALHWILKAAQEVKPAPSPVDMGR